MAKKKGMELSITYLVTMLVMLFLVISTLMFFFRSQESSEELLEYIDVETERQIIGSMTKTSAKFLIPEFRIETMPKKKASFIVAIHNVLDNQETFTLRFRIKEILDEEGQQISSELYEGSETWFFEELGPYTLASGEVKVLRVPVNIKSGKVRRSTVVLEGTVSCPRAISICNPYGYSKTIEINVLG